MSLPEFSFDETILRQGEQISRRLEQLREEENKPDGKRTLRQFQPTEVANFLDITTDYLRTMSRAMEAEGVLASDASRSKRVYDADQFLAVRDFLDRQKEGKGRRYVQKRRGDEKLQIITVVNFKGGSGKTTTAAHLAQHLALTGHRVLAVDLDPQASLSSLFDLQPEVDNNPSLYDAIRYDEHRRSIKDVIMKTIYPTLDIVPANLELQEFEYETALAMQSSVEGKRFFTRLGRSFAEVDDLYDVVVVDCPPQLGYLTLSALSAATAVLVTVHPQMLDLMSMSQFLIMLGNLARTVKKAGGHFNVDWLRYLITRYEPTDIPQSQMVGFMHTLLPNEMLHARMLKSTAISDAGLRKQTLYEVNRKDFNKETYDRAMESVFGVNAEVQGLVHRVWGRSKS